MDTWKNQRGQVGLIVLLTMVVLLTIGVSVASRSVTELRLSRQEEETSRTFEVAETGVEEVMGGLGDFVNSTDEIRTGNIPASPDNPVSVDYTVEKLRQMEILAEEGQTLEVNLQGAAVAGLNLLVYWAQNQTCPEGAAIEITVINAGGSLQRSAYTSCSGRTDNLPLSAPGGLPDGYVGGVSVPLAAGDAVVRIKPLYTRSMIRVAGDGWDLPVQLYHVSSVATNEAGGETRAIAVQRTIPAAPSVFDYVLFSGTSLVQ